MKEKREQRHPVYSNNVIEFVTVAAEYCSFLENSTQNTPKSFIEKMTKILPLLYLKSSLLPSFDEPVEDIIRQFVSEDDYEYIQQQIRMVIGEHDEYLEVFHPDMQYSDTPLLRSISEDLTDIYQDLKDMIGNFQSADLQIMNDTLANCKENFKEFWGQKLLNALRALHNILYSGAEWEDSEIADADNLAADLPEDFIEEVM